MFSDVPKTNNQQQSSNSKNFFLFHDELSFKTNLCQDEEITSKSLYVVCSSLK